MEDTLINENQLLYQKCKEFEKMYSNGKQEMKRLQKALAKSKASKRLLENSVLDMEEKYLEEKMQSESSHDKNLREGEQKLVETKQTIQRMSLKRDDIATQLEEERNKTKSYFEANKKLIQQIQIKEDNEHVLFNEMASKRKENQDLKNQIKVFETNQTFLESSITRYEEDLVLKEAQVNKLIEQILELREALEDQRKQSIEDRLYYESCPNGGGFGERVDCVSFTERDEKLPEEVEDGSVQKVSLMEELLSASSHELKEKLQQVQEEKESLRQVVVTLEEELLGSTRDVGNTSGGGGDFHWIVVLVKSMRLRLETMTMTANEPRKEAHKLEAQLVRLEARLQEQHLFLERVEALLANLFANCSKDQEVAVEAPVPEIGDNLSVQAVERKEKGSRCRFYQKIYNKILKNKSKEKLSVNDG